MPGSTDHRISKSILQIVRQESRRKKIYPLLSKLYLALVIVGLLNFFLFLAATFYIGGDAVNGKVENGKYYVWGYRYHDGAKGFTQVSRGVFEYSRWHVYSVWVTWSAMIVGTVLYKRLRIAD
jgi:hypothetical protein